MDIFLLKLKLIYQLLLHKIPSYLSEIIIVFICNNDNSL